MSDGILKWSIWTLSVDKSVIVFILYLQRDVMKYLPMSALKAAEPNSMSGMVGHSQGPGRSESLRELLINVFAKASSMIVLSLTCIGK